MLFIVNEVKSILINETNQVKQYHPFRIPLVYCVVTKSVERLIILLETVNLRVQQT